MEDNIVRCCVFLVFRIEFFLESVKCFPYLPANIRLQRKIHLFNSCNVRKRLTFWKSQSLGESSPFEVLYFYHDRFNVVLFFVLINAFHRDRWSRTGDELHAFYSTALVVFFWFVFGFCFDVGCSKCVVAFYFTLFAAIFFLSIWIVCQKHCRYICWMIRRTLLFDEKCVAFGALFSPDGQGYLFNERIFSSYDWLFGHN